MRTGKVSDGTIDLPFSGSVSLSRHASYQGAKAALPRAGSQALRVLLAIKEHAMVTDHELVEITGLPLATVNARRNFLFKKGLIHACGSKVGPYGVSNVLWSMSEFAKAAGVDACRPSP